jgi:ADP-heptose:LPS heptosyltransferase
VSARPEKILALQFKYLGDAVFLTPALRAIKEHLPDCELHVLVAAEVAPLLENLSWIKKVWPLPRTRGQARLRDSWPIIRALRREKFDRVVDFGGNDRGAILSFSAGAKVRLAPVDAGAGLVRKFCYTDTFPAEQLPESWVQRHLQLLSAWQIPPPKSLRLEIASDAKLAVGAAKLLPSGRILCHLATSQPKKEWPPQRWAEFYRLATVAGFELVFSSGTNERERGLLAELKKLEPKILALPPVTDLRLFLAVLQRADAVVSGDTGPLHFAAGLRVPIVGLFATSDSLRRAAPVYRPEQIVAATGCACESRLKNFNVCEDAHPCMASISPERVLSALKNNLAALRA